MSTDADNTMRTVETCPLCAARVPFYYIASDGSRCLDCHLAGLVTPRRIVPREVRARPAAELARILLGRPSLADLLTPRQRRLVALLLSGHTPADAARLSGVAKSSASSMIRRVLSAVKNGGANFSDSPRLFATSEVHEVAA